jgi:hypothetical protein
LLKRIVGEIIKSDHKDLVLAVRKSCYVLAALLAQLAPAVAALIHRAREFDRWASTFPPYQVLQYTEPGCWVHFSLSTPA